MVESMRSVPRCLAAAAANAAGGTSKLCKLCMLCCSTTATCSTSCGSEMIEKNGQYRQHESGTSSSSSTSQEPLTQNAKHTECKVNIQQRAHTKAERRQPNAPGQIMPTNERARSDAPWCSS
jgi:hypothetical protein